jgi:DNA polymerase III psi subunit
MDNMLSRNNYLDLMGITQWQLRSMATPAVLIPHHAPKGAQWLFILEKQELIEELPLLQAIVSAIKQTMDTVALAYYESNTNAVMADFSHIRYIVVMGDAPLLHFQTSTYFAPEIPVIISANLQRLTHDITAKRALWQQLKQFQT